MLSPTDPIFESSSLTSMEDSFLTEQNVSQLDISKRQENSPNIVHTISNQYHRLKPSMTNAMLSSMKSLPLAIESINLSFDPTKTNRIDGQSTDSIWTSSDDPHLSISPSKCSSFNEFSLDSYSPSSSSISSFDFRSNNNDTNSPDYINRAALKTFSSLSSGYNSSINSIPDHFFPSTSSDSILIPDCNLIAHLHLEDLSQESISNDRDDNKRPRSLPIDIQQPKNRSSDLIVSKLDRPNNPKTPLEHFIMSPTDKVKIPITLEQNNELKLSQPADIDFKRSQLKAIRVLYQNRFHLNSNQPPVGPIPSSKRTINPRLFRSVISCSVFEADDEHEIASSSSTGRTREKSLTVTFNCLRINFTESLLHGKILPCGIVDGFTVKLGAGGLFIPKQIILPMTTFWFNTSEHQAASPYLGFINLQCLPKRGYQTPMKGSITLALLNPNGTVIHLFLILYDLSDMPPDHRTFLRQRVVLLSDNPLDKKENLRYLAHIRFVTSQTGKLYLHSDIRVLFARNKLDYDDRTTNGKPQLITYTDMPTPKYWSRK